MSSYSHAEFYNQCAIAVRASTKQQQEEKHKDKINQQKNGKTELVCVIYIKM